MSAWLVWIPGCPLAAFVFLILVGKRLGRMAPWVAVGALAGSAVGALRAFGVVSAGGHPAMSAAWLSGRWTVGLTVDGISVVMLGVVTVIGTMIALYAIGYMRDDPRLSRFFAYFSLFCAAMLTLVLADQLVLLYVGWELVGLCSYLLISFWFEKPAAAAAGRKAFLTTRIGDTALLLGIVLLAWKTGELRFAHLDAARAGLSQGWLTLISTLIFFGAAGKSAQFPLHVWLPDAMEGPTPVSALIHAATMVAAGVYLVVRTLPLFTPESRHLVLLIGLVTHLFAATIALTMTDIKRILAYSTLSQLGLMVTALGLGAGSLAMFHLMTHAWFKALLFLAAGSVIHATHTQELAGLGGLRRAMPWTAAWCLVASLAMAGLFPLSGFWSKDAILLEARRQAPWLAWVLLGGAVMTAGYIFRLYLRCFEGAPAAAAGSSHGAAQAAHAPHESPMIMVGPMTALGLGAAFVGLLGSPWLHHRFFHLVGAQEMHEGVDVPVLFASTAAAGLGAWLAWVVGVRRRALLPAPLRPWGHRLYQLAAHKYYVDELYERWLITPVLAGSRWLSRFDLEMVDGAVNGAGRFGLWVSRLKAAVDRVIVDGLVNGVAEVASRCGAALRLAQTGVVHQYLLVVVVSAMVMSWLIRR